MGCCLRWDESESILVKVAPEIGVTKPISSIPLFCCQITGYLLNTLFKNTPKLSRHDNCQIEAWLQNPKRLTCIIGNFLYGYIKEHSLKATQWSRKLKL